jgi:hypothetical protein
MHDQVQVGRTIFDTSARFRWPMDVVEATGIPIVEKLSILRAWEADERAFAAGARGARPAPGTRCELIVGIPVKTSTDSAAGAGVRAMEDDDDRQGISGPAEPGGSTEVLCSLRDLPGLTRISQALLRVVAEDIARFNHAGRADGVTLVHGTVANQRERYVTRQQHDRSEADRR